ncbi:MAG: hypothetical protein EXR73_07210 [Myxococcales bacterium]|nr:hypothetical protein [Myxococcales bacterium]
MSIRIPGPQLGSSIPFKHLGGKGHGGRKGVGASLNLTALVDMMTMLVVFLLMTFSSTGEILMVQKGLVLPDAQNEKALLRAPLVTITMDAITFNGDPVGDPRAIMVDTSIEWKIVDLYERLKAEQIKFEESYMSTANKAEMDSIRGYLILQADKNVDSKVLNRVMKTAYGDPGKPLYPNIMFAVNQRKRR